jgi:hypothetical protein
VRSRDGPGAGRHTGESAGGDERHLAYAGPNLAELERIASEIEPVIRQGPGMASA